MKRMQKDKAVTILAIDIGGTHVKVKCNTGEEERKVESGQAMTSDKMVAAVQEMAHDWQFDGVSMGFPGPVLHGKIVRDPANLGPGWVKFDFAKASISPPRLSTTPRCRRWVSYDSGRMLFLGLGTGLGAALVVDGIVEALELGHLPYKKGRTYEDYVGVAGLERLGKKRWRKIVIKVCRGTFRRA